jgi:Protein of unknown function (DUF3631)
MEKSIRVQLAKIFALLGSDARGERENASTKIKEILARHRRSWNDLPELLQTAAAGTCDDDTATHSGTPTDANINALDLVHGLLEQYLELKPHEYVAVALWILHTHVYDQFMVSPRLALVSPVRGCGKTTLLSLLARLCARARKTDSITPAAIIRLVDREHPTLLLDEVDNAGLAHNSTLRAVLNSGHRKGGARTLLVKDAPRRFATYAPLALASIGVLPLPIMHRSIVIHMERATRQLRRFDETDLAVNHAYAMIRSWAREVRLNLDPELPSELRNRPADNWRVLIAIADSFGRAWGRAREKRPSIFPAPIATKMLRSPC